MFQQLTNYLLQFHRVSIPFIGTIELLPQPARLDVVDKVIYPPYYTPSYLQDERISRHQLYFLSSELQADLQSTEQFLEKMGRELSDRIKNAPFVWNGIGTFTYVNNQFTFEPQPASTPLPPVPAERVLREHVQHSVLVGDQVVLSEAYPELEERPLKNYSTLILWIVAALALLFILFFIYKDNSLSRASGLQMKVEPAAESATYK